MYVSVKKIGFFKKVSEISGRGLKAFKILCDKFAQ